MTDQNSTPAWPTTLRTRLRDGRLVGTDNSVWVYGKVPMGPVVDARSPREALAAAQPLLEMFEELSSLSNHTVSRRAMAKSSYREVHSLLVNVPRFFEPDRSHALAEYLRRNFSAIPTDRRLLLFGVRLKDQVGGGKGGWREAVDSVVETIVGGGTPMSDYDADYERVTSAMQRSGISIATAEDIRLANAWWNHGHFPDTPMLVHGDHLHVFNSAESVAAANRIGVEACETWREKNVPGEHAVTFASVQDLDVPFIDVSSPRSHWVADLVSSGALAVSVRGFVEPSTVTRDELRRQRKRYIDDINERMKSGKMERAEQEEMLHALSEVEAMYSSGSANPTLASASIVVGFDGMVGDIRQAVGQHSVLKLALMVFRQPGALAETMLCSNVRANPNLHDLPSQVVACSGMPSLNLVGDPDGAAVGFTERDRQIALLSPTAASAGDALPLLLGAGATGSGKLVRLSTTIPTPSGYTTMGALRVGDEVLGRDGKPCRVTYLSPVNETPTLYRVTFSDGQAIYADHDHQWLVADFHGRNSARKDKHRAAIENWEAQQDVIDALHDLAQGTTSGPMTLDEVTAYVLDRVPGVGWTTKAGAMEALDMVECPYTTEQQVRVYNAQVAIKALATRHAEQFHTRPREDVLEYRMTTGEMLAAGLRGTQGHAEFAVRVTAPLDLPAVDLPVDPYMFGYWLGDGTPRVAGEITAGTEDIDYVRSTLGDITPIENERFRDREVGSIYTVRFKGLRTALREAGVLGAKHIPITYLRASTEQRLAVLQGLMDSDGTVSVDGACELSLSDKRLAADALDLVRGLGIKASVSWDRPDGHRIEFATTQPVFRLPRKAERLPDQVRETQQWLYITDVTPVLPGDADYEPGRCISVDSPDHTYLCGDGYVVTSNTQLALHTLFQYSEMGRPGIFVDPKTGSDHSAVFEAAGGQVSSLDELTAADGIFDPIRFSATKEVGVELAASLLMSVNPWGAAKDDMEVPLQHALHFGVAQGATCIGEALAAAKVGIPGLPPLLIQRVEELAGSSPMFRACVGVRPGTAGLRVHDGITLIKVGNSHLDLPEPGQPATNLSQRIALALVRMMVFGSSMALTGRNGVVMLDEAWVFLGAGRSEVERLGRLARSQKVLPMLWTQRVTDALNAGLAGYISRGIILPIEDPAEAEAACKLFKLEPTPERMARITAKATIGDTTSDGGVAPNWDSMRALRDPRTGEVLRGSIAIYADLAGRAIPCEVVLPKDFLDLSSTNPGDIARREERTAARLAAAQAAAAAGHQDPGPDAGGVDVGSFF